MLGLDNPLHIAFVLVLLLLVFGAKRLPEMGKSLGSGLRGFKDSLTGEEPASSLTEAHAAAPADQLSTLREANPDRAEQAVVHPVVERTPVQPAA
jgi:sec-independent protein translocase protein TatA